MKNENNRKQLLKQLFATHPEVDKFHLTSDDQAFTQDHFAHAHAATLDKKEVVEYLRDKVDELDEAPAAPATDEAPATPASEEAPADPATDEAPASEEAPAAAVKTAKSAKSTKSTAKA